MSNYGRSFAFNATVIGSNLARRFVAFGNGAVSAWMHVESVGAVRMEPPTQLEQELQK